MFFLKFHFHQATAPPKLSFNIFVQLLDICGTPKMRAHTALLPEETFRNCPKTGSQTSQMWIQCSGKVPFVNIEGFRCFCEISPGNSATEIRKTHQRCDGVPKRFLAKKRVGNEQFSRYRPITKVKRQNGPKSSKSWNENPGSSSSFAEYRLRATRIQWILVTRYSQIQKTSGFLFFVNTKIRKYKKRLVFRNPTSRITKDQWILVPRNYELRESTGLLQFMIWGYKRPESFVSLKLRATRIHWSFVVRDLGIQKIRIFCILEITSYENPLVFCSS